MNFQQIHDSTHILLFPSLVTFYIRMQVFSRPGAVYFSAERRVIVEEKHLKKLLAGLCISGLVAGASLIPVNSSALGASS